MALSWRAALPAAATILGLWIAFQSPFVQEGSFAFRSPPPSLDFGSIIGEAAKEKEGLSLPGSFLRKLVELAIDGSEKYLKRRPGVNVTDAYPYWRFLPTPVTMLKPGDTAVAKPEGACFNLQIKAEFRNGFFHFPSLYGHYVRLHVEATGPNDKPCEDHYLIASLGNVWIHSVSRPGSHTFDIRVSNAEARVWDAKTRGVRIFYMHGQTDNLVWSVLHTARLFQPLIGDTPSVWPDGAAANLDFLKKYAGIDMPPRTGELNVDIPEETIQDGDFLGLIRLDGLDPMLAWAMGSATGHTAMALRFEGKLHVIESTSTTNYWPVNGIQKTPWDLWLKRYRAADYHIVHLPLSPENARKFNTTAARDAFTKDYEGFDYGYANMLWSWVDITEKNFPCMPQESSVQGCLSWELFEVLVSMLEDFAPDVAELMFVPGLRRRVGLSQGSSWAETLQAAYSKFGPDRVSDLPTSPEQDDWKYETTKSSDITDPKAKWVKAQGPQRMCDAMVCSMWKVGGLFGDLADKVQCTEFTNWDAWGLKLFDPDAASKRPDVCKAADPDNELCQLSGKYQFKLRTPMYWWNERPLVAHMAERCPSMAPHYVRPADC